MEIIKLTTEEIEERIGDMENVYAEFLGDGADANQLNNIRKQILELKAELERRKKR